MLKYCENKGRKYAKTLYKPEFPHEINEQISKYTKDKLPAFFEFAKDKKKSQVLDRNDSFVNKIYKQIPDKPINTKSLKLGDIDYKLMMKNKNIVCSKEVSKLYDELIKSYRHMINMKDEYVDNLRYVACKLRDEFNKFGYSEETVADMLVEYLYKNKKRYKQLLWFCYGQCIVNNLSKNINVPKTKFVQCADCGEWFEVDLKNNKTCRCSECQLIEKRRIDREYRRKKRMSI